MQQISLPPGRYVVAVSGGVDSMVLLDVVRQIPGVSLVVAHVDHGIRPDSQLDRELVESVVMSHNIAFESIELQLGPDVNEEQARDARYKFLRHIQVRYAADAILTAHHLDDLTETALINLIRGTGWRGLSSLRSTKGVIRPFLGIPKADIMAYAKAHAIRWREDSTNKDPKYLRNKVRLRLIPRATPQILKNLNKIIVRQNMLAEQIDREVTAWIDTHVDFTKTAASLPRYDLIMLPQDVAHEVFQGVLRRISGKSAQRPLVARAVLFCKVAKSGKTMPLGGRMQLRVIPQRVIVEPRENVVS